MKRLVVALLAFSATLAAGQTPDPNGPRQRPGAGKTDWERQYEQRDSSEAEVALPAPPKGGLLEFFVSSASSFKFFVDPQSLSVGTDGVVRFTLVARSRSGAENVSYEGMRCENGNYRVYAYANGGRWSATQSDWRRIEPRSIQRWHNELYERYFCPNGAIIADAEEGLRALRRGGHPAVNDGQRAN